ncbi:hypothetical protein BER93_04800 [Xanthomonas fragariae]|nr:hypothetical protein BER92_04800 [Xanthomonas fragariae]AOD17555.1 hypothetical protein BER93_04800 [Xanthomonas fragariae]ENZ94305.1 hypothetical protein O1K_15926 [Xanthomonas fragariae LMG 25863]
MTWFSVLPAARQQRIRATVAYPGWQHAADRRVQRDSHPAAAQREVTHQAQLERTRRRHEDRQCVGRASLDRTSGFACDLAIAADEAQFGLSEVN